MTAARVLNREAVTAIIDGFRSALASVNIPRERIEKAIAVIEGRAEIVTPEEAAHLANREPLDDMKVIEREQAAKLLACDVRTVDWYRRTGKLKAVYLPGSSRARGFTSESVRRVLRGEVRKEVA